MNHGPWPKLNREGGDEVARATIRGVSLFYSISGRGVPVVCVHGAWASHRAWDLVEPHLTEACQLVRYDRRGHSDSELAAGEDGILEDVADLAALIEHLDIGPVWVAGISAGAAVALRLAGERSELIRGVLAHEPAFFGLLADDPAHAPSFAAIQERVGPVVEMIAQGDHAGAAKRFMEGIALGPGGWETLSPQMQRIFIENAPTFANDVSDTESLHFDPAWLQDFAKPILLTRGELSPPIFEPVVAKLASAAEGAETQLLAGAGHVPTMTHPEAYANAIKAFVAKHE